MKNVVFLDVKYCVQLKNMEIQLLCVRAKYFHFLSQMNSTLKIIYPCTKIGEKLHLYVHTYIYTHGHQVIL